MWGGSSSGEGGRAILSFAISPCIVYAICSATKKANKSNVSPPALFMQYVAPQKKQINQIDFPLNCLFANREKEECV